MALPLNVKIINILWVCFSSKTFHHVFFFSFSIYSLQLKCVVVLGGTFTWSRTWIQAASSRCFPSSGWRRCARVTKDLSCERSIPFAPWSPCRSFTCIEFCRKHNRETKRERNASNVLTVGETVYFFLCFLLLGGKRQKTNR